MRVNEDIDGWVVIGPASASWLSSGSPNGFPRAGLIRHIPSSYISTFSSMIPIRPNSNSSPLAPLAYQVNVRQASGSSPTPSATHSASSSAAAAQAEALYAHGAIRASSVQEAEPARACETAVATAWTSAGSRA
jgi:hypothetical protein